MAWWTRAALSVWLASFGCYSDVHPGAISDGSAVDAPAPHSSLAIERYSVGTTVVTSPQDLSGLAATFFSGNTPIPDATTIGNTWSVPAASTSVDFVLPDVPAPVPRTLALPDADVSTLFVIFEHPNPTPAPGSASFSIAVDLPGIPASTESFSMLTAGSWTTNPLGTQTGPEVVASYPFTIPTVTSLTGGPLVAITPDDLVALLRYEDGDALSGVFIAPPLDQQANPVAMLKGTLTVVPQNQTLTATIDAAGALGRLGSATPAPTTTGGAWSLIATPAWQIGVGIGAQLRVLGVGPNDTMISATYGNPFVVPVVAEAWHPLFTWVASGSRTVSITAQSGLAVTLYAQLIEFMDASAGSGTLDANLAAPLPLSVTLAGHELATDNGTVAVDVTQRLGVTVTTENRNADLYLLDVFQLVPGAGALVPTTILLATSATPSFSLPANLLALGKTYVIRALAISGGFGSIATGDLTQRTLPLSQGMLDSGAFTVSAP